MSTANFAVRLFALEEAGFVFRVAQRTQHQASTTALGGYWWVIARCRR